MEVVIITERREKRSGKERESDRWGGEEREWGEKFERAGKVGNEEDFDATDGEW